MGLSIGTLSSSLMLNPLEWDSLTNAEMDRYMLKIIPNLGPLPSQTTWIEAERDCSCWMVRDGLLKAQAESASPVTLLVPLNRVYGELNSMTQPAIVLSQAPFHEWFDHERPARQRLDRMYEQFQPPEWRYALNLPRFTARIFCPNYDGAFRIYRMTTALRRGVRTVMELHLFKHRQGAWPARLSELDGDFVIDPYTGEPFRYERTEAGFTLYSCGFDGDDDGGRHDRHWGRRTREKESDGDYVFWPIQE
jgi:hypothetical protein